MAISFLWNDAKLTDLYVKEFTSQCLKNQVDWRLEFETCFPSKTVSFDLLACLTHTFYLYSCVHLFTAKKRKTDTPTTEDQKADDNDGKSEKAEEEKPTEESSPSTKDQESSVEGEDPAKDDANKDDATTEPNPDGDEATPVRKRRGRPPRKEKDTPKDKDTPASESAKKGWEFQLGYSLTFPYMYSHCYQYICLY